MSAPLRFFLIAGEPSGDALGAGLMAGLKERCGGDIVFEGVGGPLMAKEGLTSLFPMTDLSVMGLAEVLPRLPLLMRRLSRTIREIKTIRPDAVVTIDSPDFCFRVAKALKGRNIPLIHYVAPSVWAWRPGRARKIAGFLNHLLALLPFEPPYFERVGLACSFVGHPVIESGADKGDGKAFRAHHGIAENAPLICVLPGSREGEINRLAAVFGETLRILARRRPALRCVVPSLPSSKEVVTAAVRGWPGSVLVVQGEEEKYDAFAAADVALAASGTVTLELAMAETPTVVAYRLNPLTAWLAKRLVRVRFVRLVNIVLDRGVVPELLLEKCRADLLAEELSHLLEDEAARREQKSGAALALAELGRGGRPPSLRAADAVLGVIG
ncbi:MAG TPA: lipid-A-disaccharide synthase, partial [Rhodospirillales bacterium]|nr:lipid-A-disaccharide synthase [Rhodospirillales bacterium]